MVKLFLLALICPGLSAEPALAQTTDGSAFLACADHSDRGQRIACLEDALEAALAARAAPAATPAAEPIAAAPPGTAAAASESAPVDDPSLLDRVRAFGREVAMSEDDGGTERLHDRITALEKRDELWIVTLSSGQVWRQEVPRTLNLRVGDAIEIYQDGIGNGYRLATPRLSGFIRVERLR